MQALMHCPGGGDEESRRRSARRSEPADARALGQIAANAANAPSARPVDCALCSLASFISLGSLTRFSALALPGTTAWSCVWSKIDDGWKTNAGGKEHCEAPSDADGSLHHFSLSHAA